VEAEPALAVAPPAAAAERTRVVAPRGAHEEAMLIQQQMPATLAGLMLGLLLMLWIFAGRADPRLLGGWLAVALLVWLARLAHYLLHGRDDPERWLAGWRVGVYATAAGWGTSAWLFLEPSTAFPTLALTMLIFAYCISAVPVLVTQPRTFALFLALSLVPVILRIATADDPDAPGFALIMTAIFALSALVGRNFHRAYDRVLELQRETERLAAQLREQTAEADAARQVAEAATRAKTQFFAAASHDLRQPLHALGLFAEALRNRGNADVEAVQLVNSINSSVDALDGLFGELLDITRIDAGGVEPYAQHFALGELFRKLKLHFEPTAFEKGLALRFRGAQQHAYADPLLVERIVRNLLANAIRYTEDGGVLIGARRRGERLLLQVWDSGVGIAPAERERIFDEFYQVKGGTPRPLQPHQRKGLGLGLAIVKRLADLLDAPLQLQSQPGRGSVFTLELPLGRAVRSEPDPARRLPSGVTLGGRRIVVVEDEPAVKSGLEVLLKSWGAEPIGFDGVAACLAWAAQAGEAERPDLLIVDYRLEGAHTGIDAITALRSRFGAALPAIVVTGSLMSSHEREAQQHDFHLLIKPVVPNKLRAMIGFKLGLR
jgi:signal transduction histidine kinase